MSKNILVYCIMLRKENNMNYKTAKEIRKIFGITTQTLYNWRVAGTIGFKQITPRKFLYDIDTTNLISNEKTPKTNIIYCRVSQLKQRTDMERQKEILSDFANKNGYVVGKVFEEIASGMNENRPKFEELVDMVVSGKVNKIFISYKDRLTRFGYGYFDKLFKKFGTEIIVLNDDKVNSFEEELTADLVTIIHHFSMKMYSNRRKLLKKVEAEIKENIRNS